MNLLLEIPYKLNWLNQVQYVVHYIFPLYIIYTTNKICNVKN